MTPLQQAVHYITASLSSLNKTKEADKWDGHEEAYAIERDDLHNVLDVLGNAALDAARLSSTEYDAMLLDNENHYEGGFKGAVCRVEEQRDV